MLHPQSNHIGMQIPRAVGAAEESYKDDDEIFFIKEYVEIVHMPLVLSCNNEGMFATCNSRRPSIVVTPTPRQSVGDFEDGFPLNFSARVDHKRRTKEEEVDAEMCIADEEVPPESRLVGWQLYCFIALYISTVLFIIVMFEVLMPVLTNPYYPNYNPKKNPHA
uniref:Uncharacterized protein n=1 Tax=Plectus sambesii TaxID=2011161 RepID=A0A914WIW5_9BILA